MSLFSSDILLKKVGSLQEQNDALAAEQARLRSSTEHSKVKSKRLIFLIDKTHHANRSLRLTLFGSSVVIAALLVACVFLFTHSASLSSQNKSISAKAARIRKERRVVAERFGTERIRLTGTIEASKKENENLRYELRKTQHVADGVREEKTYLEDILIRKTKDIEKLKAAASSSAALKTLKDRENDIARLQDQNRLLAGKLEKLYRTAMDRLTAIGLAKSTLEETVADAKKRVNEEWNAVDLGSISVERSPTVQSDPLKTAGVSATEAPAVLKRASRKEGRVRAVNEAHGFVVVDLGKVDNLNEDTVLQIKKGGEWLATLTVLEVRDVMAACTVKNVVPGYKIRIDDPVLIQQR